MFKRDLPQFEGSLLLDVNRHATGSGEIEESLQLATMPLKFSLFRRRRQANCNERLGPALVCTNATSRAKNQNEVTMLVMPNFSHSTSSRHPSLKRGSCSLEHMQLLAPFEAQHASIALFASSRVGAVPRSEKVLPWPEGGTAANAKACRSDLWNPV